MRAPLGRSAVKGEQVTRSTGRPASQRVPVRPAAKPPRTLAAARPAKPAPAAKGRPGGQRRRRSSQRGAGAWLGELRRRLQALRLGALPWSRLGLAGLIALALFSALALAAPAAGALTAAWARLLLRLLGWGAYLLPPALALEAGRRLLRRSLPFTAAQLVGAALMLLAALAGTHLALRLPNPFFLAVAGYGGGIVGWALATFLAGEAGRLGAYLLLMALLLIGALLAFDLTPLRLWGLAQEAWRRGQRPKRPPTAPVRASLPPRREKQALSQVASFGDERPRPQRQVAPPMAPEPSPAAQPQARQSPPAVRRPAVVAAAAQPAPASIDVASLKADAGPATASGWQLPSVPDIFDLPPDLPPTDEQVEERSRIIEETLASLGVPADVIGYKRGPRITQFAVRLRRIKKRSGDGSTKLMLIRLNKITSVATDLALALSVDSVRIEAPIPNEKHIGIEVPNVRQDAVTLGDLMLSPEFQARRSPLTLAIGRDIAGKALVDDLARMPHLLVAGTTGSGKSVCLNSLISCLVANNTPDNLRLVLIDPKHVEMTAYNGLPHLACKVMCDTEEALGALHMVLREMDRRYQQFSEIGARDLKGYNARVEREGRPRLPNIVVVIDELADLMLTAADEVEHSLTRLAQTARATGIHLIVATQRPSVDILTGTIKANLPARIAFAVQSGHDSRVILDSVGAERLLGKGDMLYICPGNSRIVRAQGGYVHEREVARLVQFWRDQAEALPQDGHYVQGELWPEEEAEPEPTRSLADERLLKQATELVRKEQRASITMLQRHLRIGYGRAARLVEDLTELGVLRREADGRFTVLPAEEALAETAGAQPDEPTTAEAQGGADVGQEGVAVTGEAGPPAAPDA